METGIQTRSMPRQNKDKKGLNDLEHIYFFEQENNIQYTYNVTVILNPKEPKGIFQALRGEDEKDQRESAKDKFKNFIKRESWEFVDHSEAAAMKKTIIGSK